MNTHTGRSRLIPIPAMPAPDPSAGGQPAHVVAEPRDGGRERGVLVLGHRGAPGPQRGENTVRAVEAALDRGADGVEVDVRLSADGVLLCSHDPVIRLPWGERLVVAAHPSAELRRATLRAGQRLAVLEEVLEAVGSRAPAHLVVEAKPVADAAAAVRTARALEAALAGAGAGTTVTVSSFDWRLLSVVRSALAGTRVRTAALGSVGAPAHLVLRGALDAGHHEAHLSLDALLRAPHATRHARQLGVGVTAWTVNGREDLRRVAGWGVDAVITDNVVLARAVLQDVPPLQDLPAVPASSLGMTAC